MSKEMKKALRLNRISTVFLGGVMLILLYILYLMAYPFNVADVLNTPFPILNENKQIKRGEAVHFEIEVYKHMDVDGQSIKSILCEDGNLVTLTPKKTSLPVGYGKYISNDVIVPYKTSLGMCKLHLGIGFEVNPLRTIHLSNETELFEVIE